MAENTRSHSHHLANTHHQQQQQQQQPQQHQQHQKQQSHGNRQASSLANSPEGYHHQNQQQSFHPQHQSSRPHHPNHQQHPHPHPHQDYQNPTHGPFAMASMAQTLPSADYRQSQYTSGPQEYAPSGGQPTAPYLQHQGQPGSPMHMQPFFMPQHGPMAARQHYGSHVSGMVPTGPTNLPARPNYVYYPNQQQTPTFFYPQHSQYLASPSSPGYNHQATHANYIPAVYPQRQRSHSTSVSGSAWSGGAASRQSPSHRIQKEPSQTQPATVVRGPPRKPKQSGHAIWIGNLPPQTELMSLVHHVCQKTDGLQSLFLISKSNCAFANFPDEESCQVAQQKVNDTWFGSVRLVSRLRKNSVENAQGITPSPVRPTAAATAAEAATEANIAVQISSDDVGGTTGVAEAVMERTKKSASPSSLVVDGTGKSTPTHLRDDTMTSAPSSSSEPGKKGDRYFILKSLTVEDLDLSVRTGIWATQSHNEQVLNSAFNTCDNVYLVFSANKSGEYYGYAKMTSEINNDPAAAVEFAPTSHSFNEIDLPKAIPTDATENTPRGRIIDDSARGTIFWEAQSDDGFSNNPMGDDEEAGTVRDAGAEKADGIEGSDPTEAKGASAGAESRRDGTKQAATAEWEAAGAAKESDSVLDDGADGADGAEEPKAWGKPFKLEWQSTVRLPFYRTRGLRNPLNANREVKIARDGTEVDAEVGKKLVGLFHQETVGRPELGGRSRSLSSYMAGYN